MVRRLTAVVMMLGGALLGADLIIHAQIVYPLLLCLAVSISIATIAQILGNPNPAWTSFQK